MRRIAIIYLLSVFLISNHVYTHGESGYCNSI